MLEKRKELKVTPEELAKIAEDPQTAPEVRDAILQQLADQLPEKKDPDQVE